MVTLGVLHLAHVLATSSSATSMNLRSIIAAMLVGVSIAACTQAPPEEPDDGDEPHESSVPESGEPVDPWSDPPPPDDEVGETDETDDGPADQDEHRGRDRAALPEHLRPPAEDDLPPKAERNGSEALETAVEMISDPEAFGFPGASTAGVIEEDVLEPAEGRLSVAEDGAVIENLHLRGFLYITADDVTVRNVSIETEHYYGIHVDGGEGLVVEDTTIRGADDTCIAGIAFNRFTASRVHITNCEDGVRVGRDTTIEDSYIHGLRKSRGDEHNDTIQTEGGKRMRFRNNTLISNWQRQTSSILLQAIAKPVDDVVVEGNLMSGGSFTLYVEGADGQPGPTGVTVSDNVFIDDSGRYGTLHTQADPAITWSGNRNVLGETIAADG